MIPQLRFPEFTDEWQMKKLGDIAKKVSDRNNSSSSDMVLTNSAVRGVIPQTDFFDKEIAVQGNLANYYKTQKDDFVYNPRISVSAPVGPFKRNLYGTGVMSPLYNLYRFTDDELLDFFERYFNTSHWHKYMREVANYGARSDRMAISGNDLVNLPLPYPSKPEQEKIAEFLTAVDERIAAGEKKLELLQKYKKGVIQKIFTRQIRFKDENGNPYPERGEKPLREVVEFIQNGLSIDQNSTKTGYRVTRIETISDSTINTDKVGYVQTNNNISHYKLKQGDLLFSNINSPAQIGRTVYVDKDYNIYHGMNLLRIRINQQNDAVYIYYVLSSAKYKQWFERICNKAVNQASINQTDLGKTILNLPSLAEQQKIATFLTALDAKIAAEQTRLAAAQAWKKGLLQRMFV